jgi:hypothetical protein
MKEGRIVRDEDLGVHGEDQEVQGGPEVRKGQGTYHFNIVVIDTVFIKRYIFRRSNYYTNLYIIISMPRFLIFSGGWDIVFSNTDELYALILSQRYRNDSTSSDSSNERESCRAGGNWEYEEKYRPDTSRGTSSSAYPVVPAQPPNDEFRPKKEPDIKKVRP